ncbi:hypothetical protein [Diplocloster modestus]|uniref:Uncharacterized protein n=1 Tax=Diplocloster modestus TaxID=2850322 RepID=A0ABS6K637_9FIRM|nr:hypothetical protein [Diplocloster modestus]MBU9726006.1 hypothetical protein [Diplocloster modestus]
MISGWCSELLSLGEKVWSAYAMSREPLQNKLSDQAYHKYFIKASACGREQAEKLCEKWESRDSRVLSQKLGVTVRNLPMPKGPGIITFACYYEPDCIEIYNDNARDVQSLIKAAGLGRQLGDVDIYSLLLAHELFHVLQKQDETLYVNLKHIQLWKLGALHRESRLVSLEEVAAMAFAGQLLGIHFWPYIYDVLMLLPRAPEQAQKLYQYLMRLKEEVIENADDNLC